ncbi:hypothetical protein RB614_10605 [Phytohabitans sp. ZYX-F-186]|uniref:Multidrug transporter n=1 Tax=Phytohabitans maris TaxID=3071409 RepID=A0ABU0ZG92_9ACTN|nr:hypothetical protein [Phytohabitans sp. ZYX-F-186]MDQ7904972.1 hypothetical protein [Phytohabitans sp. ZYX-F-186]
MAQPEESREKASDTDAVLMHPGNDPDRETAQVRPPAERGEVRVERDGDLVPAEDVAAEDVE